MSDTSSRAGSRPANRRASERRRDPEIDRAPLQTAPHNDALPSSCNVRPLAPGSSFRRDFEQLPFTGHSAKTDRAEGSEAEICTGREIPDGSRHHDLSRASLAEYSRCHVNADPPDISIEDLDLSCVDRGPYPESRASERLDKSKRAPKGTRWCVEGRQDAVPSRLDKASTELRDFRPSDAVVSFHELPPDSVTHGCSPPGRVHNIREEDGCEDAVGVLRRLQRLDLLGCPRELIGVLASRTHRRSVGTAGERPLTQMLCCRRVADEQYQTHLGRGVCRFPGRWGEP